MRIDLLTKEYPPDVYGGAGVHVAELVRTLRSRCEVEVHCFGAPRGEPGVSAYSIPDDLADANPVLQTLGVNVLMAGACGAADLVHSHTWYANEAGRLAQSLFDIPHVVTAHSLEPLRPWKAEQLGGGYALTSHIEREAFTRADAVIAVSTGMRADILKVYPDIPPERVHVIHNGIDCEAWAPRLDPEVWDRYHLDPRRPSVMFVGRITRQKGLPYLLAAAMSLPAEVQLIIAAGAPDTPEIMTEVEKGVARLANTRTGVVWIPEHLPRHDLSSLLSGSTVFVCPSVYEPLGIVNLEAMACGTPVVGTATGGIPEVIEDGVTGWLVPIEQASDGTGQPLNPERFVADLAQTLKEAVSDPDRARRYGVASRERAQTRFDWSRIAAETVALYEHVIDGR